MTSPAMPRCDRCTRRGAHAVNILGWKGRLCSKCSRECHAEIERSTAEAPRPTKRERKGGWSASKRMWAKRAVYGGRLR